MAHARLAILLLTFAVVVLRADAQVVFSGVVVDASSGSPLPDVHLVESTTGRGTVTNRSGRFELVVLPPARVTIRHVGYLTEHADLTANSPREITIRLQPAVVPLDEIVVAGDDFAENVMRKVIRRKQRVDSTLQSWSARVYLRHTLTGRQSVSIRESVFDRYYRKDGGVREVLRSYRETDDGYALFGLDAFGFVPNFYDDDIRLAGQDFVGPTHPDALDVYNFSFARVRSLDSSRVYDIYVSPRSDALPTLIGTVTVLADESTMIAAALRPARHVPPTSPRVTWDVMYSQQFGERQSASGDGPNPWLPLTLQSEGRISVEDGSRTVLAADLRQVSVFSEHAVNVAPPDRWFESPERQQTDSATVYADYLFTLGSNIVALTPAEISAYERPVQQPGRIRSAFRVSGGMDVLTVLTPRLSEPDGPTFSWPTIYGYTPFLRYNRVDGLLSGVGQIGRPRPGTLVDWSLAQSTGWRRVRYKLRLERDVGYGFTIGAQVDKDAFPAARFSQHGASITSLGLLTGRPDYHNYLSAIRKSVVTTYTTGSVRTSLAGRYVKYDALDREIARSWPFGDPVRDNPAILRGDAFEWEARLVVGDYRAPFERRLPTRLAVTLVNSPDVILDYPAYTLVDLDASTSVLTFAKNRVGSPHLDVQLRAGLQRGNGPFAWSIDGAAGGFSPTGTIRSATRPLAAETGAALSWRHDFGRFPFDALGIDRARILGATLSVHGAHANLDGSWLNELGVGVADLFGLPARVTATHDLTNSGWSFGFSIVR